MPPCPTPLIAALLLSSLPAHALGPPTPPVAEMWVDGSRGTPGDGSRGRPYRTVKEALEGGGRGAQEGSSRRPVRVHLAVGLYAGPFVLPAGVELEGAGAATVLHAEGGEAVVVRLPEGGALRRLVVQGGGWGLEGAGQVRLEEVRFSGQRQGSVRQGSGRLVVQGGGFEAGVSETVGMALEGPVEVEVRGSTFGGPYRRAVQVRGESQVTLESVRFGGPVTAVHQVGGQVRLGRVHVEGGRGPALFTAQGGLRLEQVSVSGHEYGLQARESALQVQGFTTERAERAGLGLVRARGKLEEVVVRGSGDFAGVQLVSSDVEVRGLRVEGAAASGLMALGGRLRLHRGSIVRVATVDGSSGHGLELREVDARAEGVEVREAQGVGVLVAQDARVQLKEVVLEGCRQGGVVVEQLGEATVVGLEVRGGRGPALAAMGKGRLRADSVRVQGPAPELLWAECGEEVEVLLGRVEPQSLQVPALPCVERWERKR